MAGGTVPAFDAHYIDGVTAARVPVRAVLEPGGLAVLDERNARLALWPYRSLMLVEEVYRDQPVRLRSSAGGAARLVVRDPRMSPPRRRPACGRSASATCAARGCGRAP